MVEEEELNDISLNEEEREGEVREKNDDEGDSVRRLQD